MKTLTKVLLASGIMLVASVPVQAHDGLRNDGIRERLERQQSRIEQGIDSGQLTRKESKVLKQEQRRSRHLAREFYEDGRLSKKERHKLDRHLDRVSERIWKLKHNERSRYHRSDYRYDHDRHGNGSFWWRGHDRHHEHDHHGW